MPRPRALDAATRSLRRRRRVDARRRLRRHFFGRDLAARPGRTWPSPGLLMTLVAACALAALLLSGVRTEIQRLRYARAEVLREERALAERARALTARVRGLRDPLRLHRIARERGFVRPTSVIHLPQETLVAARDTRR